MSKYGNLVKKIEAFERLAVVGNKKDFLKSLAQALPQGTVAFPDESLVDMLSSVIGAAQNLGDNTAKSIAGKIQALNTPSYVSSRDELDGKSSNLIGALTMAKNLAVTNNSPAAQELAHTAEKALTAITSFYRNQGLPISDSQATEMAAPPQAVATPASPTTKPSDAAKRLANAVMAKVDQLPEGPERKAHLGVLDSGVKALQNIYRSLQNSKGLQDYFAKMEIVKALQKVYSQLNYDDLAVVKSLQNGHGVPNSPDEVI